MSPSTNLLLQYFRRLFFFIRPSGAYGSAVAVNIKLCVEDSPCWGKEIVPTNTKVIAFSINNFASGAQSSSVCESPGETQSKILQQETVCNFSPMLTMFSVSIANLMNIISYLKMHYYQPSLVCDPRLFFGRSFLVFQLQVNPAQTNPDTRRTRLILVHVPGE